MKKGFIVIPREFFSSKAWNEKRKFSRFEAWVDLRQMARFGFDPYEVRMGGQSVTVGRNELCSTLSALALRWDWSTKCVRMFLVRLEREGLARVTATRNCTLIRLVAPDAAPCAKGTAEGTAQGTAGGTRDCLVFNAVTYAEGTAGGTAQGTAEGTDKNKEYKEESKKEEEGTLSSLREESEGRPARTGVEADAPPVLAEAPTLQAQAASVTDEAQGVEAVIPTVETVVPTVESAAQGVGTQVPPVETVVPSVESAAQPVGTQAPSLQTEAPPLATVVPTVESAAQSVETQAPPVETVIPPLEAAAQSVGTQAPPLETVVPTVQSAAQPLQTEAPPLQTETPLLQTETPPVVTVVPSVQSVVQPVRSRRRSPAFVPPDFGEVEAYCRSAGLTEMDPAQFFDHYESVGWMAGRHRMRNWQAAARKWNRAEPGFRNRDGTAAARTYAAQTYRNTFTVQNLFNEYDRNLPSHAPRRRPDKRLATAEALRDFDARQAGYLARMDAEEPDF